MSVQAVSGSAIAQPLQPAVQKSLQQTAQGTSAPKVKKGGGGHHHHAKTQSTGNPQTTSVASGTSTSQALSAASGTTYTQSATTASAGTSSTIDIFA